LQPSGSKAIRKIYDLQYLTDLNAAIPWRSEGEPPAQDESINKCYDHFGETLKFFSDVFGRNSIDDKGMNLVGYVNYGFNFPNACWNNNRMIFGYGFQNDPWNGGAPLPKFGGYFGNFAASLDVTAHELMHGITQHTTKLVYRGQSGALNESFSDVFASMVKQYTLKQTVAEADWLIGEDILLPELKGMALRSLKAPGTAYDLPGHVDKDRQPSHMDNRWILPDDSYGVHINSGIPNHAFYLVATDLGGYSWEKAGKIWYSALCSGKLGLNCTFEEFALITVEIAMQDFGIDVSETVKHAWEKVGVLLVDEA
jgi:Zn-dependent metalloprotease